MHEKKIREHLKKFKFRGPLRTTGGGLMPFKLRGPLSKKGEEGLVNAFHTQGFTKQEGGGGFGKCLSNLGVH